MNEAVKRHAKAYDAIRKMLKARGVGVFSFSCLQRPSGTRHRLVFFKTLAGDLGLPAPVFEHHDPQEVVGWLCQHLTPVSAQ